MNGQIAIYKIIEFTNNKDTNMRARERERERFVHFGFWR